MEKEYATLVGTKAEKDILRSLILLESALEGADIGDSALKNALCVEAIDIIEAYKEQHRAPPSAP